MKPILILATALAVAGCTLGEPIRTADTDRGLFHRGRAEEAEARPAPSPAPSPSPRAVAQAQPAAPAPPPRTVVESRPAASAAADSAVIATGPRVPAAPAAPSRATAPPPASSDTIATNSRSVTAPATVLNDDEIPDAPTAALPPDPARFADAIAPSSSAYGKAQQIETRLSPAEARARLQDRLTALNFPAPSSSKDGFGGGPLLRNPGGFREEADCSGAGAGGKPVMQAAWVRVRLKGERRAEVDVSTRFEEVQESPVRGLLVRVECRSTGRLEADLLGTLK